MKKKTVKNNTLFNLKGILILIGFGIWVYVMTEIDEDFTTLKEAILAYGGNTLFVIIATYVVLVIVGLFVEGESAE